MKQDWVKGIEESLQDYPEKAVSDLIKVLENSGKTPIVIVPAGSQMTNTVRPDRPIHDYDFTVFVEPFDKRQRFSQKFLNEVEVIFVDVTVVTEKARRSTSLSEAVFALRSGHARWVNTDSPYLGYARSINIPLIPYLDLISDVSSIMKDKTPKGRAKHAVRWGLYLKRDLFSIGHIDPTLTPAEREQFLRAV